MLDFIFSIIYPKRCVACGKSGAYICDDDFAKITFLDTQFCAKCQRPTFDGLTHPGCRTPWGIDGIISSISYKGIVKKLLYQFKYKPYLSDLKSVLGRLLYEGIIQQEAFVRYLENSKLVITAVPLHSSRERERGYNQSALLAKELSIKLGIEFKSNIIKRIKKTKPQFSLDRNKRKENMKGVFLVNRELITTNSNVILVDDITTTGATLRECAKALKKAGVRRVLGITLAHEG